MPSLKDKVILITGSAAGIGKALALHAAAKGAKVVLNDIKTDKLRNVEKELREKGYRDVASAPGNVAVFAECEKVIQTAVDTFGGLDVLVNNAGVSMDGEIERLHPDVAKTVMDVNFLGSVYMTKAAIPWLKQSKGSVLFISSVAGLYGMAQYSAYSASKMALTALAQSLRVELNGDGVHVGIVYLGFTQNDPDKTQLSASGKPEPLPDRRGVKRQPVAVLAARIAKTIEGRKKSCNFSFLGKLLVFVHTISPSLVEVILSREYEKGR
jgi:NAD(P)-dependent dehydrogenase (short-subunit alcohol dehydrogenase family)